MISLNDHFLVVVHHFGESGHGKVTFGDIGVVAGEAFLFENGGEIFREIDG